MLTLKSKHPPHTWRVMVAPGKALSAGRYSDRRLWHAFREAESPGPPDGPGEYWFYYLFVCILVGGCFWMKIYEFSGWHDAFWGQRWWFVDEIDIQVKFLYSDINNTYNILSLRFDLVFPHYITYSTQIIRTLSLVRRIQNLQWST